MDSPTKFVILGAQRTGTTLVRTSLASHPDILCVGEAFKLGKKPYRVAGGYWHYSRQNIANRIQSLLRPVSLTSQFLRDLYANGEYSAIGFKLMLGHSRARPYIWSELQNLQIKVLLVKRRNVLKTLVSRRAAAGSGVYHVSKSLGQPSAVNEWTAPKIFVEPTTLVPELDLIDAENDNWKSELGEDIQYMEIVYEDYVADIQAGNRAILEFLGVRNVPLTSDLKKVNPDTLIQIVENYDDVVAALTHTKYAAHLDAN